MQRKKTNLHRLLSEAGRHKGILRGTRKGNPEDSPDTAPMRPRGSYRDFLDNIAPLRRWLRSQVNRPWDKVYSEICESVPDGMPLHHVKDHVSSEVELHSFISDRKVCRQYSHSRSIPLLVGDLYVNPVGILCKVRKGKK
jgi:hypothetical protein